MWFFAFSGYFSILARHALLLPLWADGHQLCCPTRHYRSLSSWRSFDLPEVCHWRVMWFWQSLLSSPPWLFFSGLMSFSPHHFGTYSLLGSRQLLLLNFLQNGSGTPQELAPSPPPFGRESFKSFYAFTPFAWWRAFWWWTRHIIFLKRLWVLTNLLRRVCGRRGGRGISSLSERCLFFL